MGFLDADSGALQRLIMSVEAHIQLSGYVTKQTCRSWRDEQPCSVFRKAAV